MDYNLPNRGSPNVFVGNIPYDQSEEQLKEVFSEVGTVVDFRLVFDPETGKPKGYGFCQYEDPETAASAIRNLHGVTVSGRALRVDHGGMDPKALGSNAHAANASSASSGGNPSAWNSAPTAPTEIKEGPPPAPGQPATDAVKQALAQMQTNQLLEVLTQMRTFSLQFPDQAKNVLTTRPQLAYALLQSMAMVNMGNPTVLSRLAPGDSLEKSVPVAPTPAPAPVPVPPTPSASYPAPAASPWVPAPAAGTYPTYNAPTPIRYSTPPVAPASATPVPSTAVPPAAPPVAPSVAPPAAPPAPTVDLSQFPPEQQEILQQVLTLSQAQIDAMDPEQRATIVALRQQLGA